MSEKPIVTYIDAVTLPVPGLPMRVRVLDHPRHLPGTWVYTSRVICTDGGERFETSNTYYIPGVRGPGPREAAQDGVGAQEGHRMSESPTNDEIIKQRQSACKYHQRDEKDHPTWIGTAPKVCAFCGLLKADYEKSKLATGAFSHAVWGSHP